MVHCAGNALRKKSGIEKWPNFHVVVSWILLQRKEKLQSSLVLQKIKETLELWFLRCRYVVNNLYLSCIPLYSWICRVSLITVNQTTYPIWPDFVLSVHSRARMYPHSTCVNFFLPLALTLFPLGLQLGYYVALECAHWVWTGFALYLGAAILCCFWKVL